MAKQTKQMNIKFRGDQCGTPRKGKPYKPRLNRMGIVHTYGVCRVRRVDLRVRRQKMLGK